jgi:hypothetical protein
LEGKFAFHISLPLHSLYYMYIRTSRCPFNTSGNEHSNTRPHHQDFNDFRSDDILRSLLAIMKASMILALLPLALAAPAPMLVPRAGTPIPGRYIVKMKNQNLEQIINAALKLLNKDPAHVYGFGNFGGFAADMADDIVELIRNLPGVRLVCSLFKPNMLIRAGRLH